MENFNRNISSDLDSSSSDEDLGPNTEPWNWVLTDDPNGSGPLWRRGNPPNRILVVYGLERMPVNCEKVFNLFRLYGTVWTVKVMKSGLVLVEMGDIAAAQRCVKYLHMIQLDHTLATMEVYYSEIGSVKVSKRSRTLPDGTPVRKDYRWISQEGTPTRPVKWYRVTKCLRSFHKPFNLCAKPVKKNVVKKAVPSIATVPRWLSTSTIVDFLGKILLVAIVSCLFLYKAPEAQPSGAVTCSTGLAETMTVDSSVLLSDPTTFSPSARSATKEPIRGHPYARPDSSTSKNAYRKQWNYDQDYRKARCRSLLH